MKTRDQALRWWRKLSIDDQYEYAMKVYPDWKFNMIASSSAMIEKIFNRYGKDNGKNERKVLG